MESPLSESASVVNNQPLSLNFHLPGTWFVLDLFAGEDTAHIEAARGRVLCALIEILGSEFLVAYDSRPENSGFQESHFGARVVSAICPRELAVTAGDAIPTRNIDVVGDKIPLKPGGILVSWPLTSCLFTIEI